MSALKRIEDILQDQRDLSLLREMRFHIAARLQGFVDRAFASDGQNPFASGLIYVALNRDGAGEDVFGWELANGDFFVTDFTGQMVNLPALAFNIHAHGDGGTGPQSRAEIFKGRGA